VRDRNSQTQGTYFDPHYLGFCCSYGHTKDTNRRALSRRCQWYHLLAMNCIFKKVRPFKLIKSAIQAYWFRPPACWILALHRSVGSNMWVGSCWLNNVDSKVKKEKIFPTFCKVWGRERQQQQQQQQNYCTSGSQHRAAQVCDSRRELNLFCRNRQCKWRCQK